VTIAYYPRKQACYDESVESSTNYNVMKGLDPSLRFLFVRKNNENVEDKKKSATMSCRQYYHNTMYNWYKGKQ
jgi:hypothetical protein